MKKTIRNILITVTIASGVLTALSSTPTNYEKNYEQSVATLKANASEVCKWRKEVLLQLNSENTKPEQFITYGQQLQEVTGNCDKYIQALFTKGGNPQQ